MTRHLLLSAALACCLCSTCFPAVAQNTGHHATVSQQKADGQLTFFSDNEVRFFIYLNGKLQNENSTGRITLNGLEDKPYHVRIVMDDPFEVAATRTMRPGKASEEYIVSFNPVKERIFISRHNVNDSERNVSSSRTDRDRSFTMHRKEKGNKEKRLSRREQAEAAAAKASTGKDIKSAKTPYIEEE